MMHTEMEQVLGEARYLEELHRSEGEYTSISNDMPQVIETRRKQTFFHDIQHTLLILTSIDEVRDQSGGASLQRVCLCTLPPALSPPPHPSGQANTFLTRHKQSTTSVFPAGCC